MDYDPTATIRRLKLPLLLIYGGSDPWVPAQHSVNQLGLLAREQPNIRYVVIPNANHEMTFIGHETMPLDVKTLIQIAPTAPAYFVVMASGVCQQLNK